MTNTNQKMEILRSLNGLDPAQAEKVLDFIRALPRRNSPDIQAQRFKREAMKQIGQALGKGGQLHTAF